MTQFMKKKFITGVSVLPFVLAMSAQGFAEENATEERDETIGFEEILVTAQKRSENIQSVPVAVTAFSGDELEARNIQGLANVADVTPNLLIQTTGTGNNIASVFIRGVGQSSQQIFFDQGVGTYVDGVYRPTAHGGLIDLLNVERIEVLRGPQGDLYGKNAIGGAISIVTRQPDAQETYGSINAAVGSYDRIDARAFVNIPISQDKLGLQISAATRNVDGFVDTLAIDGDDGLGSQNNIALRAAVKWNITDNVSWTGSVDFMDMSSSGSPMHHRAILASGRFNAQHNTAVEAGLLGNTPLVSDAFLTGDPLKTNITGVQHRNNSEEMTLISRLVIDFGSAELVALTSYKDLETNDGFDADGTPIDVSANNRFVEGESFSQELQLSGLAFDDKLDYLIGVYYLHDETTFNTFAENNISTTPFVGIVPGFRDRSSRNLTDQTLDSFAVFANASYSLTEQLTATLGARYMHEEKDLIAGRTNSATTTPTEIGAEDSGEWSSFSPKFQLEYAANDDVLVYGSVAKGFKSGGINNQINDDGMGGTFLLDYDEEQVWSYEIGLKADWFDNRFRTNLALFYMDYSDLQSSTLVFDEASGTQIRTITNSGGAKIKGFELESALLVTENFTVLANLAYLDTEYNDDLLEDPSDPDSLVFVGGDPLAYAPEFSFSVSGIYEIPVGDTAVVRLRADYSWRDLTYFEPEGTLEERLLKSQDSFGLLNLSLTYDSGEDWSVSAYGTNVTDERYRTGVFIQERAVGVIWDLLGRPAEWGLKFGYDF